MNIYSMEVKICATVYVKAENAQDAKRDILAEFGHLSGAELPTGDGSGVIVSGEQYDSPDMPDISISPAVTFYGPWDEDAEADFVESLDKVDDDDEEVRDDCN